jgi:hypothetical protein
MRIHSNVLDWIQVDNAASGIAPNVNVSASKRGSRSHAAAFEVSMEGNGYRGNSGSYGAKDASRPLAATWDEWGVFLGRLYVIDPEMLVGNKANPIYASAEHFHWSTGNRFSVQDGYPAIRFTNDGHQLSGINLPADTHKRHSWVTETVVTGSYHVQACKGSKGKPCSAIRRFVAYGHDWSEISDYASLEV